MNYINLLVIKINFSFDCFNSLLHSQRAHWIHSLKIASTPITITEPNMAYPLSCGHMILLKEPRTGPTKWHQQIHSNTIKSPYKTARLVMVNSEFKCFRLKFRDLEMRHNIRSMSLLWTTLFRWEPRLLSTCCSEMWRGYGWQLCKLQRDGSTLVRRGKKLWFWQRRPQDKQRTLQALQSINLGQHCRIRSWDRGQQAVWLHNCCTVQAQWERGRFCGIRKECPPRRRYALIWSNLCWFKILLITELLSS